MGPSGEHMSSSCAQSKLRRAGGAAPQEAPRAGQGPPLTLVTEGKGRSKGRQDLPPGTPALPTPLTSCRELWAMSTPGGAGQVLVNLLKVHSDASLNSRASRGVGRRLRGRARGLWGGVPLPSSDVQDQWLSTGLCGLGGLGMQEADRFCGCNGEYLAGGASREGMGKSSISLCPVGPALSPPLPSEVCSRQKMASKTAPRRIKVSSAWSGAQTWQKEGPRTQVHTCCCHYFL